MFKQRFLKYVFVVLALALWAGTAHATLTASGGPLSLTYVVGGGTSQGSDTDISTLIVTSSIAGVGEAVTSLAFTGTTCLNIFNVPTITAGGNALPAGSPLTVVVNESSTKLLALTAATNYSCTLTVTSAANSVTYTVTLSAVMQPLLVVPSVANTTLGSSVVRSNPVAGAAVDAKVKLVAATYVGAGSTFIVDPSTVPQWLTVTPTGGGAPYTASAGGNSVAFQVVANAALSALPIGNTTITVSFIATGFSYEVGIPFTMTVLDDPGTLSLLEGPTATIQRSWTKGTPIPMPFVTPVASNGAVAYSITCGITGTNLPASAGTTCKFGVNLTTVQGVALPVGSPVTMSFGDPNLFNKSLFGATVDVTLTVNTVPATTAIVIDYVYTVQPADPTLVSLSPTAINQGLASGAAVAVTLTGTGFVGAKDCVPGANPPVTRVFVGGTDRTIARSVVLSSTLIMLNIAADDGDIPALSGATSANLPVGVANVGLIVPTAPVASVNLVVTTAPVIYSITSTASYSQPAPGNSPNAAPYEMVSIFGDNFGMAGDILGAPDAFNKYGTTVTLDGSGTGPTLSVSFTSTAKGATAIAAPILFANATQINVLVPSGLVPSATVPVNVAVTSGTATSAVYPVNIVAADPGIFTMDASGIGQGAILNAATYVLNGSGAAAADHTSDSIAIFLAGMGTPDSAADDATTNKGGAYPAGCVAISDTTTGHPGYLQVVNKSNPNANPPWVAPSTAWKNIDGAVFQANLLLGSSIVPCFTPTNAAVKVTVDFVDPTGAIAKQTVNASWAGFAPGSVAGLYQVNVPVPAALTAVQKYLITVHVGSSTSSQGGVTLYVK